MKKRLGHFVLSSFGWTVEGKAPEAPRFIIIAAPHTTNWDLLFMVSAAFALGIRMNWLGKHSLFVFPIGPVLRYLGGIPVVRSERRDMVQQMADRLRGEGSFGIAVPPEGTRSAVEFWRSGFYRMAEAADVPIALCFLDYKRKQAGLGLVLTPSGDVRADMDKIRAFYADKSGKYPEKFLTPRLREEDEPQA